jgi:hypothetical protein
MIHSVKFTCVLDTNVIYPIAIRDLLLWFAYFDLYTPKWSASIFSEWKTVMRRKGLSESEIEQRTNRLNQAFPDAFRSLVRNRRNPELDEFQVLDLLRRNGLTDTANYLHSLL